MKRYNDGHRALDWYIPQWAGDARCREIDADIFFPEKGQRSKPAKAVCRRCEVQAECLEYAIENQEQYGVFGGLSARERFRYADRRAS